MDDRADTPGPGDLVGGRYRLDAVVGRGGMSTVFRATDVERGRQVAVKVLSPAALAMSAFVDRMRREARAASRLRSEHVVRIHEVGELPSGVPYLVMEHLVGSDLAVALATRGPFPVSVACACILQACEALAEAHALGIVHRDLKPANLFLVERPDRATWIKVLDFGISRAPARDGFGPLTDPGTVLGTPAYMAPEQMEGTEPLDGRADVWALGTILYELLAGRPRVRGDSLPHVFVDVVRSPPPRASRHRRDVPRTIDSIIARCLAVDPARRYPSVAALARAIAPFAPGGVAVAARVAAILGVPEEPRRGVSASTVFAAAASLAAGAAIGFVALSRDPPAPDPPPRVDTSEPVEHDVDAGVIEALPVTIAAPAPR